MKNILVLFIICLSIQTNAQNQDIVKSYDSLIELSNNWSSKYKLVSEENLNSFKQKLKFSVDSLDKQVKTLNNLITKYKKEINNLENKNLDLNNEIADYIKAKNEINLFGIQVSVIFYQIFFFSIIIILLIVLTFLYIKYRNRNIVTQEAKENLASTTKEFEDYKHRAIEKQQKLGRELLDAKKKAQSGNRKK